MKVTPEMVADFLRQNGPATCTDVGEHFWGRKWRTRQSYARPAGAVLKRAIDDGLV